MMERYKDNGLCDFLKERYKNNEENSEIKFFDTDKSLLVVASKKDSVPICLIIDDRIEKGTDASLLSGNEKYYGNECYKIAQQAKLPLFWVRYVDCEILENSDYVYLWHSNNKKGTFERIQLRTMIDKFAEYGIKAKLENRTPQKSKNDSLSSAFHIWQRECLRIGIFADIDLIRMHDNEVVELIELKRSYIDFNNWNPYNADINNFAILSNFCNKLGDVDFHIVFNTQLNELPRGLDTTLLMYYRMIQKHDKGIYYDKIDILKIYQIERRENIYYYPLPYPVLLGTIKIEDYLEYKTYKAFVNEKLRIAIINKKFR